MICPIKTRLLKESGFKPDPPPKKNKFLKKLIRTVDNFFLGAYFIYEHLFIYKEFLWLLK